MIDVYFWPTPNGKKITIQLEEAGIPYNVKPINIGRGDQLSPDFLKISPNGRMPAIVDHEPMGGGSPITVFESGAIISVLGREERKVLAQEPHQKSDVMQWVFWQIATRGQDGRTGWLGHTTGLWPRRRTAVRLNRQALSRIGRT
jgi:GST-like protein